jgi:class 3 adenylate cyclase
MSTFLFNKDTNKTINISNITTFKVGRLTENNLSLQDIWISRRHAMIQQDSSNSYYAIDLGSANGTFINNIRIITPTKLASGDIISFGKTDFIFQTTEVSRIPAKPDQQTTGDETVACINQKKATILVCDIHRYTELSEIIGNEEISHMLQSWNRLSSEIIHQFKGQIDKFIGDAVLAFWIYEKPDHLIGVLSASLLIQQMTSRLGEKHNLPFPLSIGAAINTGDIMQGNIGGTGQRDYTMVGDAVNTTFRLEAETTKTQEIIIGKETHNLLESYKQLFTPQIFDLKGKKDKIEAYTTTFRQLEYTLNQNNTIDRIE